MSQPIKRGRGRPRKGTKRLQVKWNRFVCDHANPVAQVHLCMKGPGKSVAKKDPTAGLQPGECFVIYQIATPKGPEERVYAGPYTRADARQIADDKFRETDEEDRFGSLDGPERHILYRNEFFEVQYVQAESYVRPFIIVDTRFGKVLLDGAGKQRRFYCLSGAVAVANEEEGKLK